MKIPCVLMRGGTSKAVVFHKKDLPEDQSLWDNIFLKIMGSPDAKEIDGLGGAHPTTSKIAVISKSESPDYDIDYTFYQVAVDVPQVSDNLNCGNISSAVGVFAIDEGLVEAKEPITILRIYNTNTKKFIEEHVRVENGKAKVKGDTSITGVPGTASPIDVLFEQPGGCTTGKLFPTGNKRDILSPKGYSPIEVTAIDCSHPAVLIPAQSLGLTGTEIENFRSDQELLDYIEAIRSEAAVKYGFVEHAEEATEKSLAAPNVAIISKPQSYVGTNGNYISEDQMDICSRVVSVGAFHETHPITTGIAVAAASKIPGTVAYELARKTDREAIRIGHPYGILEMAIVVDGEEVVKGGTVRTARRLMEGIAYITD